MNRSVLEGRDYKPETIVFLKSKCNTSANALSELLSQIVRTNGLAYIRLAYYCLVDCRKLRCTPHSRGVRRIEVSMFGAAYVDPNNL